MFGAIWWADFGLFVWYINKCCESSQENSTCTAACLALISYAPRLIAPMNSISLRRMSFFLFPWIDIMQAGSCRQFFSIKGVWGSLAYRPFFYSRGWNVFKLKADERNRIITLKNTSINVEVTRVNALYESSEIAQTLLCGCVWGVGAPRMHRNQQQREWSKAVTFQPDDAFLT